MRTWAIPVGLSLALFIVFAAFFRTIILTPAISSDFGPHIDFARTAYEGTGVWPRHVLFFALVALTSFWSTSLLVWQTSAWMWLAFFVAAKFLASVWFGRLWVKRSQVIQGQEKVWAIAAAFGLTVVFCFPQPAAFALDLWYAYSFPPNTWHNSTQIAVMPIAIIVFGLSVLQLDEPGNVRRAAAIAVFAVLSALAKPSFLMAWLPSYGICTLIVWARRRSFYEFVVAALPIALAVAIVLLQYYFIYVENINNSGVKIGYLDAWTSRVDRTPTHFYIAVFFSSLFPIVFYALHPKKVVQLPHILSIGMVIISYLFAMGLSETGSSIEAGNFMWPIISANFISYMVCACELPIAYRSRDGGKAVLKAALPAFLFGVSSLWGVAYLIRYIEIGTYR